MKQRLSRVLRWLACALGYLALLLLAATGIFGILRTGWGLQYAAQLLIELLGPAIFVALIGAAMALTWRWLKVRRPLTLAMATLSGISALACAFTIGGYVAVAHANGVSINFIAALWPGLPNRPSGAQTYVYDRFGAEDARLLVYRPESKGSAPMLLHIHGGGWVQGSAADRAVDDRWFANHGYLVIDADYTLSSNRRHLWNVTQPQLGCALSWIAKNAARLGGDPNRIALYGESAGGNLVLNLGHLANAGNLPSRCGGSVPQVSAVISMYPPVDMPALYRHEVSTIYPLTYIGGAPERFTDRYAYVSPKSYVRAPGPPTMILTGLDDSLVPVSDTLKYVDLRRAAGHEVRLITIPRAGHGFDVLPGSIGNQLVRETSLQFLIRHGLKP